ncbi:MAG: zinc-ribbon domain-containing protein [Litoreibacter sp.]|nr:zinc-ribbon domain-containing protein [Litoreibacter sp.]
MRLICPNCDAEYEVDADLFPPEGREVQCSNCSNTWYVKVEGGRFVEPGATPSPPSPEPEAPKPSASDETQTRQEADPKALDILHAEVEREKQARAAEASGLETQADLGLDDAPAPSGSETAPELDEAVLAPAPRRPDANKRELLPDIEEINSTLANAPDPEFDTEEDATERESKGRSAFRMGFGLALLFAAAILAVYAYAPEIAERFPDFAEPLVSYVDFIDGLRVTLAEATEALAEKIDNLTEQVGSSS